MLSTSKFPSSGWTLHGDCQVVSRGNHTQRCSLEEGFLLWKQILVSRSLRNIEITWMYWWSPLNIEKLEQRPWMITCWFQVLWYQQLILHLCIAKEVNLCISRLVDADWALGKSLKGLETKNRIQAGSARGQSPPGPTLMGHMEKRGGPLAHGHREMEWSHGPGQLL